MTVVVIQEGRVLDGMVTITGTVDGNPVRLQVLLAQLQAQGANGPQWVASQLALASQPYNISGTFTV